MRHQKAYRKLGRRSDHRKAMFKNLTISLIEHNRIETTVTRAKELRFFIDKMITLGKRGSESSEKSVFNRRRAFAFLRSKDAVKKLFDELAPKYAERTGGYTRIIKTTHRRGDSAELAIIELV